MAQRTSQEAYVNLVTIPLMDSAAAGGRYFPFQAKKKREGQAYYLFV